MSSTVNMHRDFQPNFLTVMYTCTLTCIFERLGLKYRNMGEVFLVESLGARPGNMHSADFKPKVFVDLIRDCGSNLYVGMRVVDSRVGKGERTS